MTADKRSVATDALETLGGILNEAQKRDAIHLAVEPVIAGQALSPGDDVGLDEKGRAVRRGVKLLGIVDPFLPVSLEPGDRFWLVVYPRRITSLRHVWEHPDFPASGETSETAALTRADKRQSEKWMRAWAMNHMSRDYYGDYDTPLSEDSAYANAISAGHDNHIGPYEDARDYIDSEWWEHWEAITGKKGDRETYFSCAC